MAERKYMNGHAWSDEYCPYKLSMQLKRRGYDEPSHSMYYTAVTHNGESISFDEELDLKGEGRGKETWVLPEGAILKRLEHANGNTDYLYEGTPIFLCAVDELQHLLRMLGQDGTEKADNIRLSEK